MKRKLANQVLAVDLSDALILAGAILLGIGVAQLAGWKAVLVESGALLLGAGVLRMRRR